MGTTRNETPPGVVVGRQPSRIAMRDRLLDRPITLWLLFLAIVTAMGVTAKALIPELLSGPAGISPLQIGLQAMMLLMVLPFAARVGRNRLGVRPVVSRRSWFVAVFPALTVAFGYLAGFRELPWTMLALAIVSVALAGLGEELAFRGVLLHRLLNRWRIWPAVVISSTLFGLMHLGNLALGAGWSTTLLQVTFAALAGTGYAAMRLRTGSLWPPIVLHALYDLTFRVAAFEPGSMFVNLIHMLHGVGWAVYALVVLRTN